MSQLPLESPVVPAKLQPNIYTSMLAVAILALGITVGIVLWNLLSEPPVGYGLTFGDLFQKVVVAPPN